MTTHREHKERQLNLNSLFLLILLGLSTWTLESVVETGKTVAAMGARQDAQEKRIDQLEANNYRREK